MAFFDDSSLVALASELQLLNHSGDVPLSVRQKYGNCTEFLAAVKYFVQVNLARHVGQNDPTTAELARMAHELDWGVVSTLIAEEGADTGAARTILQALFPHGAPPIEDVSRSARPDGLSLPAEFFDCTWQRLYLQLGPHTTVEQDEQEAEHSFDKAEVAQIIRFAKLRCDRGDRVSPALVGFIGARFRDGRRKELMGALINCCAEQPRFYQRIIDTSWMAVYYQAGGAVAVAQGLIAMLSLANAIPADDLAVALDERLVATLPSIRSRFEVIAALGRVAREAGICPELRRTLDSVGDEEQWKATLRDLAMPHGAPCTLTAQRLTCTLIEAYGSQNYKPLVKFNRRIRHLAMEESLDELVVTRLVEDREFAAQLISGRPNMKALIRKTRALNLEKQYAALMMVAIAAFRDAELGAVTRGISLLYRARLAGRIDDQHYGKLTESLFASLPNSLLLLDELPANIDGRLRRLIVPLLVAIELYDSNGGDQVQFISDAYYQLGQYEDPSERERPVQHWGGEWL